jgi:ribosomal protein S19E (S16A)
MTVLGSLEFGNGRTAKWLGVRSDVLWRLEERGLVSRNAHERWRITDKGRAVLRARS